ncbi:hypothetical protein CMZ82_07350 [Lysobacteraceae bacterium NML93-0792]|nr:hypothetical protein CMZ82_07350 [Xanthomonadaceae bacterium NML93-0792]PBS17281.1 hypothetical protein CMZ81_00290 [Xanthomonadaceae bacterium NML93-0793]PBS20482.1 hypothetical protein CMZ80_01120 [Xanthomonadaceae bacterium NML93-0831]
MSRSFRDFPTRHPWLGRKTPPIHGRRPPGLARAQTCHSIAKPKPKPEPEPEPEPELEPKPEQEES